MSLMPTIFSGSRPRSNPVSSGNRRTNSSVDSILAVLLSDGDLGTCGDAGDNNNIDDSAISFDNGDNDDADSRPSFDSSLLLLLFKLNEPVSFEFERWFLDADEWFVADGGGCLLLRTCCVDAAVVTGLLLRSFCLSLNSFIRSGQSRLCSGSQVHSDLVFK